jgi:hypothetical protein
MLTRSIWILNVSASAVKDAIDRSLFCRFRPHHFNGVVNMVSAHHVVGVTDMTRLLGRLEGGAASDCARLPGHIKAAAVADCACAL